jgi:hypothetical protein
VQPDRYRVSVEFRAELVPAGGLGRRVSKFEGMLPANAAVRLVRDAGGTAEVEVHIDSLSAAAALRDVARAVELVTAAIGAEPGEPAMGDVVNASVERVPAGT